MQFSWIHMAISDNVAFPLFSFMAYARSSLYVYWVEFFLNFGRGALNNFRRSVDSVTPWISSKCRLKLDLNTLLQMSHLLTAVVFVAFLDSSCSSFKCRVSDPNTEKWVGTGQIGQVCFSSRYLGFSRSAVKKENF